MKIIYIEPLKKPVVMDIPLDLDVMHSLVKGMIQAVYPWDDPLALVCNDNGIAEGLPLNRVVGYDIIHGPFFICGLGEEDFDSVPEDLVDKYISLFAAPEVFIPAPDGHLAVIKIMEKPL